MSGPSIAIIGGGLAGLSAGIYARLNGFETHIYEHNLELGGVCSAWYRDPYLIDGCIRWLMGAGKDGAYSPIYEETGMIPAVPLQRIDRLNRIEHPDGWSFDLVSDLDQMKRTFVEFGPQDADEIERFFEGVQRFGELQVSHDAPEIRGLWDRIESLWEQRGLAGTLLHFRGSLGQWRQRHIKSERLQQLLGYLLLDDMPVMFIPVLMSELARGHLYRPQGGSGRVRDAIVRRYTELGGTYSVNATVEEVLVREDKVCGVRLADGTQATAEHVVCTASAHETARRLLGGRYLDRALTQRLDQWPLFQPIVLVSVGVELPLTDAPHAMTVIQREPFVVGETEQPALRMHVFNDDLAYAPVGHAVVQSIAPTTWDWWSTRGSRYHAEKTRVAHEIIQRIDDRLPGTQEAVRMIDVSTPLTFWRHARAWQGAYEGWLPTTDTFTHQAPRQLPGLANLYLAGQWVEPGGGVPTALLSGRQAVQLLCSHLDQPFRTEAASEADDPTMTAPEPV